MFILLLMRARWHVSWRLAPDAFSNLRYRECPNGLKGPAAPCLRPRSLAATICQTAGIPAYHWPELRGKKKRPEALSVTATFFVGYYR